MREDAKIRNFEKMQKVAKEELTRMRSPFWFLSDDGHDSDDIGCCLAPFYRPHFQEKKGSTKIDDMYAKMKHGNKIDLQTNSHVYHDPSNQFNWAVCFTIMTYLYLLIVILGSWYRSHMVCQAVCALCIYFTVSLRSENKPE